MKSMMRTFRSAGMVATLIAALAVSACASKPGDNSMASAGAATPGSEQDFVVNVGDRVFFECDSSELTWRGQATLDKQARWLQQYSRYSFTIEGHADERGTREYNIALGARRAQAVRDYLAARGIQPSRMRTVSYGKERPVAVCNDISCWSQNRRAVTVLNGIPVQRFRNTDARRLAARAALGIAPDAPVIGCVGRLVGLKNHRLLLEQVPALAARHPQLQVVLAGDGPLRADLAAQAQGLKIADRVHLLGARNDVADILPAFDVFALPSQTEGLSIALLEACATGLAIVATKVGGNPEIVHHGDTGLLVEVDDGPGLGAALETLLDDAALRARLGANACDWVAQHASVDALRLAYDAFYAAALATR